MIKTPLSTMIGGAFWTPGATVIGGSTPNLDQYIRKLFANNEQGFFYDPNDLGTMYQDAAGRVPVTAAGQPVGLILDKGNGIKLGEELSKITSPFTVLRDASSNTISPIVATLSVGKTYLVVTDIAVSPQGLGDWRVSGNGLNTPTPISVGSAAGRHTCLLTVLGGSDLRLYGSNTGTSITVDAVSVRELKGNHAYQTTSAARPILQDAPRRIDFDAVDDKLITSLPAQLTGCTVVRSVPGVGTQILTNQTIPATYEDNTDHCGLIVINRALTATETSQITKIFNKAAGV